MPSGHQENKNKIQFNYFISRSKYAMIPIVYEICYYFVITQSRLSGGWKYQSFSTFINSCSCIISKFLKIPTGMFSGSNTGPPMSN